MSLERACANCMRCFNLARENVEESISKLEKEFMARNGERLKLLKKNYRKTDKNPENVESYEEHKKRLGEILEGIQMLESDPGYRMKVNYGNYKVYQARNEAMRALEETQEDAHKIAEIYVLNRVQMDKQTRIGEEVLFGSYLSKIYNITKGPIAQKALNACESCDYSTTKIVEVVNKAREEEK